MASVDRPPKRRLVPPTTDTSESSPAVQMEKGSSGSSATVAAAAYVAENDTDALDCGVCFLPLKPPIFQCVVGHVVCSPCHDGLKAAGKCHVCSVAGAYHRCHAMERVVESVRVPCTNAVRGCTARPAYYDQRGHTLTCEHAPCCCPGEACGFTGSTETLWDHFIDVHNSWPRFSSGSFCRRKVNLRLQDGFNVVRFNIDCDSTRYLFLLNVLRQPLGRAISVLRIHHHAATEEGNDDAHCSDETSCELSYTSNVPCGGGELVTNHLQKSCFRVSCTDLSDGLPSPDSCFQVMVPDCVVADNEKDIIKVTLKISITVAP